MAEWRSNWRNCAALPDAQSDLLKALCSSCPAPFHCQPRPRQPEPAVACSLQSAGREGRWSQASCVIYDPCAQLCGCRALRFPKPRHPAMPFILAVAINSAFPTIRPPAFSVRFRPRRFPYGRRQTQECLNIPQADRFEPKIWGQIEGQSFRAPGPGEFPRESHHNFRRFTAEFPLPRKPALTARRPNRYRMTVRVSRTG